MRDLKSLRNGKTLFHVLSTKSRKGKDFYRTKMRIQINKLNGILNFHNEVTTDQ